MADWFLPDPFMSFDGTRISNTSEWPWQRQYLLDMLDRMVYGIAPTTPSLINETTDASSRMIHTTCSTAMDHKIRLTFNLDTHKYELPVHVLSPVEQSQPWTPIIMIGTVPDDHILNLLVRNSCALIICDATKLIPDDPQRFTQAPLIANHPAYSWRAIRAWAWLESRVIDWLTSHPQFNHTKIVVVGHSRYGKTALYCAAHDERVTVCAPVGSGCGGMGSLRYNGSRFGHNIGSYERIGQMCTDFPHWLLPEISKYGSTNGTPSRENELPFDAHTIAACIAPRRLIVCEGLDDPFNNIYGTQVAWMAAAQVWRFLRAGNNIGLHCREGGHELRYDDWETILNFTLNRNSNNHTHWRTIHDDDLPLERNWQTPRPLGTDQPV